MHKPTNRIDRLAKRLLDDGYVDDEVEAVRLAVRILQIADPVTDPEADGGSTLTDPRRRSGRD